jgi:hypothetical protein
MGAIQSLFFRPSRGYRKYIEKSIYEGTSTVKYKTVGTILYQLDGVISEQHESIATVTSHPVEYGVNLTDHVIKQPMKIVVNGIVTNSPSLAQLFNILPGDANFVSQAVSTFTGARVRNAYQGLIALQNAREPLRLQTGLMTYDNMILTNVSAPNNLENNLKVRLTFTEIFVADGTNTGALQGITTTPTDVDWMTVAATLGGLGIAGLTFI